MTPIDAALIRRKLARIAEDLRDLEALGGLTSSEYATDRLRRKATERMLQEVVDAAVDCNLHLLRERQGAIPADYYRSFIAVGEAGMIPADLAEELAPAAGLRNRLVHEYDRLDDGLVQAAARDAVRDFARYVASVESYLEGRGV